jgi:hypothetical protein
VAAGACAKVSDSNVGRGNQPVINVSWNDGQRFTGVTQGPLPFFWGVSKTV